MNIISFFTAYFSNFKGNLSNLGKKNRINNLKINIIINNIIKIKGDDNLDFLNNKGDFKRGNKRKKRFYDREDNNKNKKV